MALSSSLVWEYRASTGSNNNGGGYSSGGTDYSQQASSALSVTDGATSGIGVTTLTSATGGFTAAMIGNIIYLRSGTNLTVGWYEITAWTDTNTVTLDRAPDDGVGGVSGGTGEVGGARAVIINAWVNANVAGNKTHIKNDGTMTLTEHIVATADGTPANPIIIEGYNTTRGDLPTGTDRPLIACGAYNFQYDDYWFIYNLRGTTTYTYGFRADRGSLFQNCSVNQSSATASKTAYMSGDRCFFIDCEAQAATARGLVLYAASTVLGCYIHDSVTGIYFASGDSDVSNNIIDTCAVGVDLLSNDNNSFNNNTFFGDKANQGSTMIAIQGTDPSHNRFVNNIFDNFDTAVSFTTDNASNWFDYNNWSNNTTDVTNATKGPNATALDPQFTDDVGKDFTVGTNMKATGTPYPTTNTGLSAGQNYIDQGAMQRVEAGGGGGSEFSFGAV